MRSYLFVFISVLLAQASFAQGTFINGKITDAKSKESIPSVNIQLEDKSGGVSDANGIYSIAIRPGKHQVSYNFVGYKTEKKSFEIKENETLTFNVSLSEDIEMINEIVVSAGKFEQKLSDVTISMEIIKPSMIENNNTVSMDAVLNQIPGLDIMDDQPSIRGGSGYSYGAGSRVLMLIDDMPILSADVGDVKWNFIPLENLSQVEVIKGASSALFGSSALNGVINMRTAYPKDKSETKITIFDGIYMNPQRKELIWWSEPSGDFLFENSRLKKQPHFKGLSFYHSEKYKNMDIVLGGNAYTDDGYREFETEQRVRENFNIRYRDKKIDGLAYGLNGNFMLMDKTEFFLWQNADSGAYRQDGSVASRTIGSRINLDPFVTYFNKKGHKHSLRGRYFNVVNKIQGDSAKNSTSDMYYTEYQYQRHLKEDMNWTIGALTTYSEIVAELFGDHYSHNISLFTQIDKKFGLLNISAGIRGEYYRIDKEETHAILNGDTIDFPIQPVYRLGASYQLAEHSFLRASFGQGYRFPTVAEKFTMTSVSSLNIFPNPKIQSETGWSTEVGIKQGFRISGWNGYVDLAGFWTEYHNMMEYTFGFYNPQTFEPLDITDSADLVVIGANGLKCLGFQSINVGNARINGIDLTVTGTGKLFGLSTVLLAGYTYTNPIDMNSFDVPDSLKTTDSEILKYRNYHSAKADIEIMYKKVSTGLSVIYTSKMINIDKAFEDLMGDGPGVGVELLPGLYEYRQKNNKGTVVFDYRISYTYNEHSKFSLVVKNLFNKEYMGRPGDLRPPRSLSLQYVMSF